MDGGCWCGCGCYDHVVKWMSVWVWMLRSCCEVVDVGVGEQGLTSAVVSSGGCQCVWMWML